MRPVDRVTLGDLALRDHRGDVDPELRSVPFGFLVERRDVFGRYVARGHEESESDERSIGDLQGALLVPADPDRRRAPSWSFALPAVTTRASPQPGVEPDEGHRTQVRAAFPSGVQDDTRLVGVRPIHNQGWESDERYAELEASVHPEVRDLPVGTRGIVLAGTHETDQETLFLPIGDLALVAAHRGGTPEMSSVVYDLTPGGEPDRDWNAPLHSMVRAVRLAPGCAVGPSQTLAWLLGLSGLDRQPGRGLVADSPGANTGGPRESTIARELAEAGLAAGDGPGGLRELGAVQKATTYSFFGNSATLTRAGDVVRALANPPEPQEQVYSFFGTAETLTIAGHVVRSLREFQSDAGNTPDHADDARRTRVRERESEFQGTVPREGDDPPTTRTWLDYVLACASARVSGPFEVGGPDDVHRIGEDEEGRPVNALHLSTRAYWHGHGGDGPQEFSEEPYDHNMTSSPFLSPVHLRWDGGDSHSFVCGEADGKWRWQAEVPYYDPSEVPPEKGPGIDPCWDGTNPDGTPKVPDEPPPEDPPSPEDEDPPPPDCHARPLSAREPRDQVGRAGAEGAIITEEDYRIPGWGDGVRVPDPTEWVRGGAGGRDEPDRGPAGERQKNSAPYKDLEAALGLPTGLLTPSGARMDAPGARELVEAGVLTPAGIPADALPRVGDPEGWRLACLGGRRTRAPLWPTQIRAGAGVTLSAVATAAGEWDFSRGGFVHAGQTRVRDRAPEVGALVALGESPTGAWGDHATYRGRVGHGPGGLLQVPSALATPEELGRITAGDYLDGADVEPLRHYVPGGVATTDYATPDGSGGYVGTGNTRIRQTSAGALLTGVGEDGEEQSGESNLQAVVGRSGLTAGRGVSVSGGDAFLEGGLQVLPSGDVGVVGDLTVTERVLDPTGVAFAPQASDPLDEGATGLYSGPEDGGRTTPQWRHPDGTVEDVALGEAGEDPGATRGIYGDAGDHGTSSTSLQVLDSTTVPAGTLLAAGDALVIRVHRSFSGASGDAVIQVTLGGQSLIVVSNSADEGSLEVQAFLRADLTSLRATRAWQGEVLGYIQPPFDPTIDNTLQVNGRVTIEGSVTVRTQSVEVRRAG